MRNTNRELQVRPTEADDEHARREPAKAAVTLQGVTKRCGVVRNGSPKAKLLGLGLIVASAAMIPWLYLLATHLPTTQMASNWSTAWVGLDSLEILGMLSTGLLLLRGDARHRLVAAATAMLFITDAWFDITTAPSGFARGVALALAAGGETPVAVVCGVIALRRIRPSRVPPAGASPLPVHRVGQ